MTSPFPILVSYLLIAYNVTINKYDFGHINYYVPSSKLAKDPNST